MISVRIVAAIVILVSISAGVVAQEVPAIAGRVIDNKTGSAIPFATIRLKTSYGLFGVVSNNDGDFQIPGRYRNEVDTIRISCIGYITNAILLNQLKDNQVNVVRLKESTTRLSEVIVERRVSAFAIYNIVKTAIERIPVNYPVAFNSYLGYYRDYQLLEQEYTNLNEAIVGVYDEGFDTNDLASTDLNLFDYKKNDTFKRDSLTAIAYDNNEGNKFIPGAELFSFGGNELMILRIHDAVRNSRMFSYSFVNQFDKNFLENHLFKLEPVVYADNVPLYHISFKTKPRVSGWQHSAKGHLYIERKTYAIHKLDYSVYNNVNWENKPLYSIQLEYSKIDSLMRLNYISFTNYFKVRNPDEFKIIDVMLDLDAKAFIVEFNQEPEETSVKKQENYHFRLDGKKMEIERISLRTGKRNQAYVYIKSEVPEVDDMKSAAPRLKYEISNIKDVNGKEVNKVTYIEARQFREFFVQSMDPPVPGLDAPFIDRYSPLSKSQKVSGFNPDNYWMNTPLKKE